MAGGLVQIDSPALTKRRGPDDESARAARRAKWSRLLPQSALVYVENRCHLKCAHCYETEESHPPQREHALDVSDYRRIFTELADLGVLNLTLTGGEIFLRRDIFEILDVAKELRFFIELFTSGTHITEEKADRLATYPLKSVEISVYSHDPQVHDDFTGIPGSHARSVAALERLHARGVRTTLKSNLMTFNVDHIDEMIALADRVGAKWTFDPSVKPKMNGDRSPLRFALDAETLAKKVFSRPDLHIGFEKHAPEEYCSGSGQLLGDGVMCGAARSSLAISADGEVLACGFFKTSAGSLKERALADIWFGSAQLDAVRDNHFKDMVACSGCEVRSNCSPCMAYSDVEHDGDIRQCATSSRQLATGIRRMAERRVKAAAKMNAGKALPLVGDLHAPRPPQRGTLDVEP